MKTVVETYATADLQEQVDKELKKIDVKEESAKAEELKKALHEHANISGSSQ
jgi:hypothetical protein